MKLAALAHGLVVVIILFTGMATVKDKPKSLPKTDKACILWNDTTIYNVPYELHNCATGQPLIILKENYPGA